MVGMKRLQTTLPLTRVEAWLRQCCDELDAMRTLLMKTVLTAINGILYLCCQPYLSDNENDFFDAEPTKTKMLQMKLDCAHKM